MEIKVRNINSNVVDKIDETAKLNGQSRNEFLCEKLKQIAFENEICGLENKYQFLIDNLIEVTKQHTKVLGAFMNEYLIDGEDASNIIINYKDISKNISSTEKSLNYYSNLKTEFKVRDIPIDVLSRIDEIAKERDISRNEFINIYLRQLTYSNELKLVDEKYNYMIEKTLGILEFSDRVLKIFYNENIINKSQIYYEG